MARKRGRHGCPTHSLRTASSPGWAGRAAAQGQCGAAAAWTKLFKHPVRVHTPPPLCSLHSGFLSIPSLPFAWVTPSSHFAQVTEGLCLVSLLLHFLLVEIAGDRPRRLWLLCHLTEMTSIIPMFCMAEDSPPPLRRSIVVLSYPAYMNLPYLDE